MKYLFKTAKIACIFSLLLFDISRIFGQATGDIKEDFLYGEYYLSQSRYSDALPFYESILNSNPDNSNINYRIGLCYSKMIGEQAKALPFLKKAVIEVTKNYPDGNYKNTASPIESWLLLGDAYHRNNELTNASYAYNKYLELLGNNDLEQKALVKRKIQGIGISYEFQRTENHIVLMNMGPIINSRFSDYNPVISGDQKTMVYTQYLESFDRIMITRKTDNSWSTPVQINDEIGSYGDCYTSAISFNGDELFLIRYGDDNYNIYSSKLVDGKWTKMTSIGKKINSKHQESSICISSDGSMIYFSSDRPGGEGGFDIYSAERLGNEWGNVKNLGKAINTKRNEEGPYISYDGNVLYFSSDGHETVGNMDILYSELDNEGNWQSPVNIGFPINTTNDDLFYIYFKNTKTGYLSRDLTEGLGKNDIYAIVNDNIKEIPQGAFLIQNVIDLKLNVRDDNISILHSTGDYEETDSTSINNSTIVGKEKLTTLSSENKETDIPGIGVDAAVPVAAGTTVPVPASVSVPVPVGGIALPNGSAQEPDHQSNTDVIANTESNQDGIPSGSNEFNETTTSDKLSVNVTNTPTEPGESAGGALTTTGTEIEPAISTGQTLETNNKVTSQTASIQSTSETGLSNKSEPEINNIDSNHEQGVKDANSQTNTIVTVHESGLKENTQSPISSDENLIDQTGKAENKASTGELNDQSNISHTTEDQYLSNTEQNAQTSNKTINAGNSEEVTEVTINSSSNGKTTYPVNYTSEGQTNEIDNPGHSFENLKADNSSDTIPIYTIQIMALKNPRKCSHFKIKPLIVSHGIDGLYRYTTGEYKGWSAALVQLEKIRANGFPDAFISNIGSISNYSKKK